MSFIRKYSSREIRRYKDAWEVGMVHRLLSIMGTDGRKKMSSRQKASNASLLLLPGELLL